MELDELRARVSALYNETLALRKELMEQGVELATVRTELNELRSTYLRHDHYDQGCGR